MSKWNRRPSERATVALWAALFGVAVYTVALLLGPDWDPLAYAAALLAILGIFVAGFSWGD